MPQKEVNDPVLPQSLPKVVPSVCGLPQKEVSITSELTEETLNTITVLLKEKEDKVTSLPQVTVPRSNSSLMISAWCPSVSAMHTVLPRVYNLLQTPHSLDSIF